MGRWPGLVAWAGGLGWWAGWWAGLVAWAGGPRLAAWPVGWAGGPGLVAWAGGHCPPRLATTYRKYIYIMYIYKYSTYV